VVRRVRSSIKDYRVLDFASITSLDG